MGSSRNDSTWFAHLDTIIAGVQNGVKPQLTYDYSATGTHYSGGAKWGQAATPVGATSVANVL